MTASGAIAAIAYGASIDRLHYNHFVWFGQINKALGKTPEAKASFQEALRICKGDKNWPEESMKPIIAYVEKEIASCD